MVSEETDVVADPALVIVVVIGACVTPELTYVTVSVECDGAGETLTTERLEDVLGAAGAGSAVVLVKGVGVVCIHVSRMLTETAPCTHASCGVWSKYGTLPKGADKSDVCCDGYGNDYAGCNTQDRRCGTVVDGGREGIATRVDCGNGLYVFEGRG